MSLCVAAGAAHVALAWSVFTLAWMHSVERIEWQEDWRVTGKSLVIDEARVKGTGAGMEPPVDAHYAGGWWHYRPQIAPLEKVVLARSGATADWRLCNGKDCLDLAALTGNRPEAVTLRACDVAAGADPSNGMHQKIAK